MYSSRPARVVLLSILVLAALRFAGPFGLESSGAAPPPAGERASQGADSEGLLYPIQVGGKWGYVNQRGKFVIEPKFNYAMDFGEDSFATVCIGPTDPDKPWDRGRSAVINRRGEIVLPAGSATLGRGRFVVTDGNGGIRFGGLLESFETTLRCQLVGRQFKEGVIPVCIDGQWGFMDEQGKLAIKPMCDSTGDFSEGLAIGRSGDQKWGYIDHAGRWAIKPQFESAWHFSEGLAVVRVGDRKFFIDRSGQRAIQADFESAFSFSEGLAPVRPAESKLDGYIDRFGRFQIAPRFKLASPFQEGLAYAVTTDGVAGYIDHSGEFVIKLPGECYGETGFRNGRAPAHLDRVYGLIDRTGAWVCSFPTQD